MPTLVDPAGPDRVGRGITCGVTAHAHKRKHRTRNCVLPTQPAFNFILAGLYRTVKYLIRYSGNNLLINSTVMQSLL